MTIECDARRHHAFHPVTRLGRTDEEVDFAEHAVEMEVEAGQPIARAETEARRQDAGVPIGVDGDEVRRVRVRPTRVPERGEQEQDALGRSGPAQIRQTRERLRHAGQTAAREEARMPIRLDRLAPAGRVRLQVSLRQQAAALVREREQRAPDRAGVRAVGALGGERLERCHEAGLLQPVARLEQPSAGRVHPPALAQRHDRLEHRQAGGVSRGHLDAAAGEAEGGLDKPRPRQAAVPLPERSEAGRNPRDRAAGRPDRIVDRTSSSPNGTSSCSSSVSRGPAPRPGTAQKQSRFRALPAAASQ